MKLCVISPHLPPDQGANAIFPLLLGREAARRGDEVIFVAHTPRTSSPAPDEARPAILIPQRLRSPSFAAWPLAPSVAALEIAVRIRRAIATADLVHVHSNGLLPELGALLAFRRRRPFVLTLYGTEIWHFRPKRLRPDLFRLAHERAAHVVYYSRGLLDRAKELDLARREASVIYPPVGAQFRAFTAEERAAARAALGIHNRQVLLNVKRLHELAGQRYLIEAMPEIIRTHPDTRLVICGDGELRRDLVARAAAAGLAGHVTFAGLVDNTQLGRYYAAADLFVLPSLLEACPTVALEALACGVPVLSSDNPGGAELAEIFTDDITIVPRRNALALAREAERLLARTTPTSAAARASLERDFRLEAVSAKYFSLYARILGGAGV